MLLNQIGLAKGNVTDAAQDVVSKGTDKLEYLEFGQAPS